MFLESNFPLTSQNSKSNMYLLTFYQGALTRFTDMDSVLPSPLQRGELGKKTTPV